MGKTTDYPLPVPNHQLPWYEQAPYEYHYDRHPVMGWGFMVYWLRWHMHRMKQADMARFLGTTQTNISRWERGKGKVPPRMRTFLLQLALKRLEDGLEAPQAEIRNELSRTERQRILMIQHGTFGGKGGKRRRIAA